MTTLGSNVFSGCTSLTSITLPESLTEIYYNCFDGCTSLASVKLPGSLIKIYSYCFNKCTALTSIELPASVASIGDHSFYECTSLSEITLSNSLQTIGDYAFANTKITAIAIPKVTTKIGNGVFKSCSSLTNVKFVDGPDPLTLGYNGTNEQAIFYDCPLETVYIGRMLSYNTSNTRGYSPFYNKNKLTQVTVSDYETNIYAFEFYGCSSLKEVSVGGGVVEIGDYAFSGCRSLENFSFGSKLAKIGEQAFNGCTGMATLVAGAITPPECGWQALEDINKWTCRLYTRQEAMEAYKVADQWKDFQLYENLSVEYSLFLNLSDASISVRFSDSPVITFPDDKISLSYNGGANQWLFDDFFYWCFSEYYSTNPSGIDDVLSDGADVSIIFNGDIIKISSPKGGYVSVSDITGNELVSGYDIAEIDMAKHAAGIYIIRVGNKTVKYIKK